MRISPLGSLLCTLVLVVGASACGGGDDDAAPSCTAFEACGGDLIGTWNSTGICTSQSLEQAMGAAMPDAACRTAYRSVQLDYTEAMTFRQDGTYQDQASMDMDALVMLDLPCIQGIIGSTVSASQLPAVCAAIESGMTGQSGVTSATCDAATNACSCTVAFQYEDQESGTYTASGGTITNDQGDERSYCVKGNTVTVRATDETLGDAFVTFAKGST